MSKKLKAKKKRYLKKWVLYTIGGVLIVFLLAIFFFFYELTPVSNNKEVKSVVIEKGSISSIGKTLKEYKLIRNVTVFKLYVKLTGKSNLKASTYELSENMGMVKIISILENGNLYNSNSVKITFKEGINYRRIASLIAKNTDNTEEDVYNILYDNAYISELITKYWFLTDDIKNNKIYYSLEGYLFPDTYYLTKTMSVKEIFKKMLDETEKKLSNYKTSIENLDLSINEYFTLASIVELEGASANDRKAVAGVFYNRIKDGWVLGSDVTTYYGSKIDDFKTKLTSSELNDCSNEYNTRCKTYTGLPVGPIANPGMDSLLATLYPENHSYYYFVADCSGKVYLNTNASGHDATISKLVSEGNWCA